MTENCYELTLEQEKLGLSFKEKWDEMMFSTQPINQRESLKAIYQAYDVSSLARPRVIFCQSQVDAARYIAVEELDLECCVCLVCNLRFKFVNSLDKEELKKFYSSGSHLFSFFNSSLYDYEDFCEIAFSLFYDFEYIRSYYYLAEALFNEITLLYLCEYDFLIEAFQMNHDKESWHALKYLAQECPYTFAFRDICLVIERPTELNFDRVKHLHAEGKPAVSFVDGSGIYAFHGTIIPEKYGKYSSSQWQLQSCLAETFHGRTRTLLRGIGYERFRQEMPKSDYSFWQEYQDSIREASGTMGGWFVFNCFDKLSSFNSSLNSEQRQALIQSLPFKITNEVREFYRYFSSNWEIAPNLFIYPLEKSIKNNLQPDWLERNSFALPVFYSNDKEVYCVVCSSEEKDHSEIWYVKKKSPPKICGINITSLILSITECYETGAYYIAQNEETAKSSLQQDRSKVETIFRKFNPDSIEVWQEIWDK